MTGKINASHLERQAVVYVRQSTAAQVMDNKESTLRQYGLARRAQALGWAEADIEVIDEDLGQSGKTTEGRSGFARLAETVAEGKVGAIFALEVSRLARSSHDWQQLLSLCAVAEVVVADEQTIYDPRQHDDKLLLDLKGTMSEAELHWLSLRMAGARRGKAQRGEMRLMPPTGYLWAEGGYQLDPDESVRQAIQVLFERFAVEPSASAVVRWARQSGFKVPARRYFVGGSSEVRWRALSITRLCNMLRSPVFAGVYAYGRGPARRALRAGKIKTLRTMSSDPERWVVKIHDAHPAYISWEAYLKNKDKLRGNDPRRSDVPWVTGPAKQGRALLAGLLLCGRCGRRMHPVYAGYRAGYFTYCCDGERTQGGSRCFTVPGQSIDAAVEELFLHSMVPDELSLALAVENEAAHQAETLDKQWRLRLEQAAYQARLAERRYKAVDPDHRVVARTLEQEWNRCLEQVAEVERQYRHAQQKDKVVLSEADRKRIRSLAGDLPAIWRSATTRPDEKKAMLRLVVEVISLRAVEVPLRETVVGVQWKSGVVTELHVRRPSRRDRHRTPEAVVEMVRALIEEGCDDEAIATRLNEAGHTSGRGMPFNVWAVQWVRQRNGIRKIAPHKPRNLPLPDRHPDGRFSVSGLAKHFRVSKVVVYRWIQQGKIQAAKAPFRNRTSAWWISLDRETEVALQSEAAASRNRLW